MAPREDIQWSANTCVFDSLRANGVEPFKLPWQGRHVPHAVIELTEACNLRCDGCYKRLGAAHKPFAQIREEIDAVISQRHLSDLTLSGGEPTLHPEINEVIAYTHSRGVRPLLLTNGMHLTAHRLRTLREAGLAEIMAHVDAHQQRPDADCKNGKPDLNEVRARLAAACVEAGLPITFVVTLYRDSMGELDDVLALVKRSHTLVRGVLGMCYGNTVNFGEVAQRKMAGFEVRSDDVVKHLYTTHGALPFSYVASSHDDKALCWTVYLDLLTTSKAGTMSELYVRPGNCRFLRFYFWLEKLLFGHYQFGVRSMSSAGIAARIIFYTVLSFSLSPILRMLRFVLTAWRNGNIRALPMVFQQPPVRHSNGEYEFCSYCPDATIRNGKLMPTCLADIAPAAAEHALSSLERRRGILAGSAAECRGSNPERTCAE